MSFSYLFYKPIMFRMSCGVCHFANTKRPSDITIADFWGWEKTDSNFNADNKGCSLVLLNTEKGHELFKAIIGRMNIIPANLEDCLQPNMIHPSEIHPKREKFEKDYASKGFLYVYFKYGEEGWRYRMRPVRFYSFFKKFIKSLIFQ